MDRTIPDPAIGTQRPGLGWRRTANRLLGRPTPRREDIDAQARWMGRGKHLKPLSAAAAARTADRLGVHFPAGQRECVPGVSIGRSVLEGTELFGSFEDLHLDIWGPRQGKTTSRVIPAILSAPGAVITTSAKRDVVDVTYGARAAVGQVWVFDPHAIMADTPAADGRWSWDPLSYVIPPQHRGERGAGPVAGATSRADKLAAHFATDAAGAGDDAREGKSGEFFETEARELLAGLFLAAAAADEPISVVWLWVNDPRTPEAIRYLEAAGYPLVAAGIRSQYSYPPDQRSGVFGTAKKMIRCLKSPELLEWITPHDNRRAFDPHQFLADARQTLYLLSTGESGSGGAIINALTEAVLEAATDIANRSGGRLPTPLMAVLDEAANVVRWRELPQLYSHFGSRGIIVMTILQSWAQGVSCWGQAGMTALWSAAAIRVLGAGVADTAFLRDRAEDVGAHHEITGSVTHTPGQAQGSVTRQRSEVQTLTVSDLVALPRGRMVVFAAGLPPILAVAVPYWQNPICSRRPQPGRVVDPLDLTRRLPGTLEGKPSLCPSP